MEIEIQEIESFIDERASRYFDLFPQLEGQITVSIINEKQFSGWHKHLKQYDIFFVASGKIKVATISPDGNVQEEILSSENPRALQIPAGYWHCYQSISSKSCLIYFLSRKHDETDEIRATEEEIYNNYNYSISI